MCGMCIIADGEMVRIGLQLRAVLDNVTGLRPREDDFRWYLKLRCANCGEQTQKWNYATLAENKAIKGGHGSANLVSKCKLCSRENTLKIVQESIKPYTNSERFQTVVVFECRGVEPVDYDPRGGWCAGGENSGTVFADVDLSQKEWTDYDESEGQPVSILELEHKFIKL